MKKLLMLLLLVSCKESTPQQTQQTQQPREELWFEITCPVTTDNIVVDTVRATTYLYSETALHFYNQYDSNIRQVPKTCFNKQIMN